MAYGNLVANPNVLAHRNLMAMTPTPPMPITRAHLDEMALQLHFEVGALTETAKALQPFGVALRWIPAMVVGVLVLEAIEVLLLAVMVFGGHG